MQLKALDTVDYFGPVEQMTQILMQKTQTNDPLFFRILVSYYLTKVASMMRTNIHTEDRGEIPVSMYAINLALSGHGKGHSTNIVEEQVINEFRTRFLENTFPLIAERSVAKLSNKRAAIKNSDVDHELELTNIEFDQAGVLPFSFDSATTAAVKQVRHKALMAEAGSLNMEIDEIGDNLLSNADVLSAFLELYDVGKIKQKLTKNTKENIRNEEIDGRTPANMMLFGTPTKLLDGSKTEDEFQSMLNTGYARRCFFGYCKEYEDTSELSPEQVLDMLTDKSSDAYIQQLSQILGNLSDRVNFNTTLTMTRDVNLLFIRYKLDCEKKSKKFPWHKEMMKAEMDHRYFKALKLAGTYAFIDQSPEITEDHFYNAIKLAEDSGEAFNQINNRDLPHVRLARYIASMERDLTHADIAEDLPFYKGSEYVKRDLMTMAIAWGNQNNIIIKRRHADDIEFFRGESLKETNLDNIIVSYGTDIATGYLSDSGKWEDLYKIIQAPGYHWVNHHLGPMQ